MTEGEWMGDRWSMMLSLRKPQKKKKMFLFVPPFLCQKKKKRGRERGREKKKEKSKSYPLHLKQINLISLSLSLFLTIHTEKKEDSQPAVPQRTSAFDAVHYNASLFFCLKNLSVYDHTKV
jgi:hypothetical protein